MARKELGTETSDLGYYPEALADEGYLRKIPIDPVTGAREWELVFEVEDE